MEAPHSPLPDGLAVDPLTHAPLHYDPAARAYRDAGHAHRYPVTPDGVADFNPTDRLPLVPSVAAVHQRYGTPFHYRAHYQADAEYFDYAATPPSAIRAEHRRLHETILRRVPPPGAGAVLDVGCGNAWLAGALLARGHRVLSADVSTVNPARALARYPHPRHHALVADAYFLPLADASVQCVVAAEVVEHVADPVRFIASLYRVLAPGGRLIVTTPYAQVVPYHLCVHCDRATPTDAHIHSFHPDDVGRLAPPGATFSARPFNHPLPLKLRLHRPFGLLPHRLWRHVDRALFPLPGKPARYLIEVGRPAAAGT